MRNATAHLSLGVCVLVGLFSAALVAQTAKKPSIWDQVKDAAKKAQTPPPAGKTAPPAPKGQPQPAVPGSAPAWTPPVQAENAAPVVLDPAKLPDVVGVHLGMAPPEAMQIMRKAYPANYRVLAQPATDMNGKPIAGAFDFFNISDPATAESPLGYISFTAPPEKQVVWRVARETRRMHVNRETLLATLREKYGKETVSLVSSGMGSKITTDDSQIADMFWLFDEHGGRVPLPPPTVGSVAVCPSRFGDIEMPTDDADLTRRYPGWCASFVGVHVAIPDPRQIVESVSTEMIDLPLAMRTAHASIVWQRALAEKAHQEELERSKKAKPVF
jgi:hypothetical protein